jgi:hypothetical protein
MLIAEAGFWPSHRCIAGRMSLPPCPVYVSVPAVLSLANPGSPRVAPMSVSCPVPDVPIPDGSLLPTGSSVEGPMPTSQGECSASRRYATVRAVPKNPRIEVSRNIRKQANLNN